MNSSLLHVITTISNPVRWKSRISLYNKFKEHMLQSGVRLTVAETAYGDIPHVLDDDKNVHHVPLYAKTHIWIKENTINLAIARLPRDWKYVAWIDADIFYRKPNWASELIYALQHYDFVQPWEHCYDLGPNDEHIQAHRSLCSLWHKKPHCIGKNGHPYEFAHPGFCWAATRSALEKVGGLLDMAILGAADHAMALALVGKAHLSLPGKIHENYAEEVFIWQQRANQHINGNIGFIPYNIEHMFHGRKDDRKYVSRWDILTKHKFDPRLDIKKNTCGVYELTGNKPELKRDIEAYFRQRNEDINCV